MQDWELIVQFLWLRIFQSSLLSIPASALKVEAVDVNTFLWMVDGLAFDSSIFSLDDLLEYIGGVLYFIEWPGLLLSIDLLLHGSQETLRIKESCQPEWWWSFTLGDPEIELGISIKKTLDPTWEGSRQPGNFCASWVILELFGDSEIEYSVDGVNNIRSHTDATVNGIAHSIHGCLYDGENTSESLQLLSKEDVKRN